MTPHVEGWYWYRVDAPVSGLNHIAVYVTASDDGWIINDVLDSGELEPMCYLDETNNDALCEFIGEGPGEPQ